MNDNDGKIVPFAPTAKRTVDEHRDMSPRACSRELIERMISQLESVHAASHGANTPSALLLQSRLMVLAPSIAMLCVFHGGHHDEPVGDETTDLGSGPMGDGGSVA